MTEEPDQFAEDRPEKDDDDVPACLRGGKAGRIAVDDKAERRVGEIG